MTSYSVVREVSFNLRAPGQYFDAETDINYNANRDYDSATGRYIESDPVGLKGGINPYAYVRGNTLRYVDPLGLQEADLPGYEAPENGKEAAGFFDPEFEDMCVLWNCAKPNECRRDDLRKSTDFIRTATDKEHPAAGCYCEMTRWGRVDKWKWDSNGAISGAKTAADAATNGPSMWRRLINALTGAVRH